MNTASGNTKYSIPDINCKANSEDWKDTTPETK